MKPHPHGNELARWGRNRLQEETGGPKARPPTGAWCEERAATFVTLRWEDGGDLQGCVGSLIARRPIVEDVAHNAIAAALHDPRSEPVSRSDVSRLDLELSILSSLEPIRFGSEREALSAIRPGVDGIVLAWRGRSATFLPSMWEQLPGVVEFMEHLKLKLGLQKNFWDDAVRLERYTVDKHVDTAEAARRS